MNKNRNGFTLVELLVTIVVLGIVTGISIPLIRNIRNSNEDKQYITYMDSVKYSAKLYVDSYSEDLFGHEDSGCAIIQYTDLEDKSLVNDISLSDVSCATEDTYIRVVKLGEKYGYSVSLGCGNKNSEGKVESITIKYPEEVISKDSCGIDAKTIMDFQTTPEKSDAVKYKRRNVTLTISSATGVHTGAEIQYGFSKDKGTTVEGGWTSLPISITGEKKQKERIEAGETISIDSDKLTTPVGLTGDYYLVLRIDKLQDVLGRAWTTDKDQSKYIYKGPFRVDNTAPTISNVKVESTTTYNNLNTKVTVTGSDNYSSGDNLKMCISNSSNDCAASEYKKYTSSSQNHTVSGDYDGKTRTIYVHLKDAAGNHSSQSVTYTVASKITYDGNGNTGGSTAVTYCDNNVDCTLRGNGFTKTGYGFDGWYTAKTGGTKYGATTKLTGNITVYAHWNASNYTITYNLDGGSVSGNPTSYTITSNDITLKNPTKIGYTFEGWTGSNGNTKQKSVKISKGSTGNKSYTAHWKASSFTVSYDANGGSDAPASQTKTTGVDLTLSSKKPTITTDYSFAGWGTAKSAESVTYSAGGIYQKDEAITLYAIYKKDINGYRCSGTDLYYITSCYAHDGKCNYSYKNDTNTSGKISRSSLTAVTASCANYEIDGSKYSKNIQRAISLANADGTIQLLNNYTDTSQGTFDKNVTFDTNGKILTRQSPLTISSGASVTFRGVGAITSNKNGIAVVKGTLTITGGYYYMKSDTSSASAFKINSNGKMIILDTTSYTFIHAKDARGTCISSDGSQSIDIKATINSIHITGEQYGIYAPNASVNFDVSASGTAVSGFYGGVYSVNQSAIIAKNLRLSGTTGPVVRVMHTR